MSFSQFELNDRCLQILKSQGIEKPTPVQAQAIPIVAAGHDLIATAQTGTGKTLGFALPSLTRLAASPNHPNRMLVLVPTRELAVQVHEVVADFAKQLNLRTVAVYGGVGMNPQVDALRRGCAIVVATPGRLMDHMEQGTVNFSNLNILVLDEADRMLDMGFLPTIRQIVRKLPKERQTLMFSATFADDVSVLAREMLRDPKRVTIGQVSKPVNTVRQAIYTVNRDQKASLLKNLLKTETSGPTLVFTRTKHRADRVGYMLKDTRHSVAVIHGNRTQGQRQNALDGFKTGKYQILVATDVAARGLDVDGIGHVINFDIPDTPDAYIHRIGRTGRAQATGDAITFVTPEDYSLLREIEKTIGRSLPKKSWQRDSKPQPQDPGDSLPSIDSETPRPPRTHSHKPKPKPQGHHKNKSEPRSFDRHGRPGQGPKPFGPGRSRRRRTGKKPIFAKK